MVGAIGSSQNRNAFSLSIGLCNVRRISVLTCVTATLLMTLHII